MNQPLGPNQQLWVNALRSGEYKQGRGMLQSGDCFCCLGVACEVAKKHNVEVNLIGTSNILKGISLTSQPNVERWLGMLERENSIDPQDDLINKNDLSRRTFPEIADYIEANTYKLFKGPK